MHKFDELEAQLLNKPTRTARTRTSLPVQLIDPPPRRGFAAVRVPCSITSFFVIGACAVLLYLAVYPGKATTTSPPESPPDANPAIPSPNPLPARNLPLVTDTPTPLNRDLQLWAQVDEAWNNDWPRVVGALRELEAIEGRTPRWVDKTYAAYYNYGEQLLSQGLTLEAAGTFSNALEIRPDGVEARQALLTLTPQAPAR
jgi:hypothetical protein